MPRKATWALIIFNALMVLPLVAAIQSAGNNCANTGADSLAGCQIGTGIGEAFLLIVIGVVWFVGFVILALIWIMSRPSKRICPQCGYDVRKGWVECEECGYSFLQAAPY